MAKRQKAKNTRLRPLALLPERSCNLYEAAIRGKDRLDLTVDPPPDLAIEIDNSSQTSLNSYQALKVPEFWRYDGRTLKIYLLQDGNYIEFNTSQNFPDFPIIDLIPEYLESSKTEGRSPTIKAFRSLVKQQLQQPPDNEQVLNC
ncbi:MAG: Uma2 family endonuclease [Oscillatoriaceae cyanobacterium Prado104]|jgi:Uma2 family endonuclease|nr:Uma2 family endonuclease [Oscillatoriaceae cyanobacterium Prado104]